MDCIYTFYNDILYTSKYPNNYLDLYIRKDENVALYPAPVKQLDDAIRFHIDNASKWNLNAYKVVFSGNSASFAF
jgi:hypothetical protein